MLLSHRWLLQRCLIPKAIRLHMLNNDVEDNLNVYGSPMYEARTDDMETEAGPSTNSHVRVETTTSTRREVSRFLPFLFFLKTIN